MHIIIAGDPITGLCFYGPFITADDAIEWAEHANLINGWWLAPLLEPEED